MQRGEAELAVSAHCGTNIAVTAGLSTLATMRTFAKHPERALRDRFGDDLFPYGIEENRPTWEQMLLYTYQQGIAHRHAAPEEIFPRGIMTKVVI